MAFPTDYTLLAKITVDNTKVFGSVDEYHAVLITEGTFGDEKSNIFGSTDSGGGDVRFSADQAGSTQLPCEIVSWDTTAETCQVWVRRQLDCDADTDIYIWGDNTGDSQPAVDASYGRNAVWSGWARVFHLEENSFVDSTGTADATNVGSQNTTGKIGGGKSTRRAGAAKYINSNYDSDGNGDQTLVSWISFGGTIDNTHALFQDYDGSKYSLTITVNSTLDEIRAVCYDGSNNPDAARTITDLSQSTWYHMAGVRDKGSYIRFFWAGEQTESTTDTAGDCSTSETYGIGNSRGSTSEYEADVDFDEVWFLESAKSNDWIKTVYTNQSAPATFATTEGIGGTAHEKPLSDTLSVDDSITKKAVESAKTESLSIQDTVANKTALGISDEVSTDDSYEKEWEIVLQLEDGLGIGDSIVATREYRRELSDILPTADDISKSVEKSIAESLSISENVGNKTSLSISDSLSITDDFYKYVYKVISDEVTISEEGSAFATDYLLTINTQLSISDALSPKPGRVLEDSLSIDEDISPILTPGSVPIEKALSDTLDITDEISSKSVIINKAESLSIQENVSNSATLSLSDSETVGDNILKDWEIVISLDETLSVDDSVVKNFNKITTEGLSISEIIVGTVRSNITDELAIDDGITKQWNIELALNETLNISATMAGVGSLEEFLNDSLSIDESLIKTASFKLSLNDGISISDSVANNTAESLSDTLDIGDDITKQWDIKLSPSESLNISAVMLGVGSLEISLGDSLSIDESLIKTVSFKLPLNDGISISDSVANNISESLSDTLDISENISTLSEKILALDDSFGIVEGLAKNIDSILNDTLSVNESSGIRIEFYISNEESLVISESLAGNITVNIPDSVNVSEQIQRGVLLILTDTVSLEETVISPITSFSINLTDALYLDEQYSLFIKRPLSDILSISEEVEPELPSIFYSISERQLFESDTKDRQILKLDMKDRDFAKSKVHSEKQVLRLNRR